MKVAKRTIPIALTIAGSDSGGGAGIQADLKTFAALGVHGTSAITCVTAQNPKAVSGIQAINASMVRKQIEAVFNELPLRAVKTGMLYSEAIIRVVAEFFESRRRLPLVIDPVMVATSGAVLLKTSAIKLMKSRLLPLAGLITPNLDEAELLLGCKLRSIEDVQSAAEELHEQFGCAVLLKGGHLRIRDRAIDVLFDGTKNRILSARRVRGVSTHGTGCTYSAAICALLARGEALPVAVTKAKHFVTRAIRLSYLAGKHPSLNHQVV